MSTALHSTAHLTAEAPPQPGNITFSEFYDVAKDPYQVHKLRVATRPITSTTRTLSIADEEPVAVAACGQAGGADGRDWAAIRVHWHQGHAVQLRVNGCTRERGRHILMVLGMPWSHSYSKASACDELTNHVRDLTFCLYLSVSYQCSVNKTLYELFEC